MGPASSSTVKTRAPILPGGPQGQPAPADTLVSLTATEEARRPREGKRPTQRRGMPWWEPGHEPRPLLPFLSAVSSGQEAFQNWECRGPTDAHSPLGQLWGLPLTAPQQMELTATQAAPVSPVSVTSKSARSPAWGKWLAGNSGKYGYNSHAAWHGLGTHLLPGIRLSTSPDIVCSALRTSLGEVLSLSFSSRWGNGGPERIQ